MDGAVQFLQAGAENEDADEWVSVQLSHLTHTVISQMSLSMQFTALVFTTKHNNQQKISVFTKMKNFVWGILQII